MAAQEPCELPDSPGVPPGHSGNCCPVRGPLRCFVLGFGLSIQGEEEEVQEARGCCQGDVWIHKAETSPRPYSVKAMSALLTQAHSRPSLKICAKLEEKSAGGEQKAAEKKPE